MILLAVVHIAGKVTFERASVPRFNASAAVCSSLAREVPLSSDYSVLRLKFDGYARLN